MPTFKGSDLKTGMVFQLTATTLTITATTEVNDPTGRLVRVKYTRLGENHTEALHGESIIFADDVFICADLAQEKP